MAALDLFLKIDGIPGEAQDSKHKDEIRLESFHWGERQTPAPAGRGSGRTQIEDFQCKMATSKASPQLLLACASGQHVNSAVLTARKSAGVQQAEFLKYTFTDVLVSSYQTEGSPEDTSVVDHASFNFGRVDVEYRPQNADGSLGAPVKASWDVRGNRPIP